MKESASALLVILGAFLLLFGCVGGGGGAHILDVTSKSPFSNDSVLIDGFYYIIDNRGSENVTGHAQIVIDPAYAWLVTTSRNCEIEEIYNGSHYIYDVRKTTDGGYIASGERWAVYFNVYSVPIFRVRVAFNLSLYAITDGLITDSTLIELVISTEWELG